MSGSEGCRDEDDEISPPLFVQIQTIELQKLDFQTNIGNTAKFRHLTYIEATNLFLFVGSTSGTVYVFSRDTLKFLFIIPFRGGKVCSIACSQDESDIAVGSIRGKVSIYRISPNVHYMQSSASAPLIDAFRDIYDVPHHVGSEITEMQWSPNGKYLFLADSQGLVSQMDVACLDEFPRPIPSKVILKLQARVLQLECSFPYLAVCTVTAVFLCDLEKEDFTRVQCVKNMDIRSPGLCLMILPERSSLRELAKERTIPSAKLMLFIAEPGSGGGGAIHVCNMEGIVQFSKNVAFSSKVAKYSMPLFDPTRSTIMPPQVALENGGEEADVNISMGKMLCTDDGMLVSASSDKLFVYDPYTMNVIAWNEEFKRINNFKIISNYAFIWAGNKLEVVAFTPFRSYGEQLFRAKLTGVLENWVMHTVYSLGWRGTAQLPQSGHDTSGESEPETQSETLPVFFGPYDENSEKAVANFRKLMCSESEEESEFTQFVISLLPFPLQMVVAEEETLGGEQNGDHHLFVEAKTLEPPIRSFFSRLQASLEFLSLPSPLSADNNSENGDIHRLSLLSTFLKPVSKPGSSSCHREYFHLFCELWKSLLVFYEDIEATLAHLDYKKSELTLAHILNAAQTFLHQPKLVNIASELVTHNHNTQFENVALQMLCCLHAQQSQGTKWLQELLATSQTLKLPLVCFTKFAQCPLVVQWFRELGTSPDVLFYDGLVADTLLLLMPLCSANDALILSSCLDSLGVYDKLTKHFMTWLFLCRFLHKPKQVQYSPLLRSMLNEQLFETLAEEMFSTIYRDFRLSSFGHAAHYLHHFVSALVLLSKSSEFGHPRNVSVLLSCFPLTKWAREDIVTKVIAACHINPALLGLYLKACLEDGCSMKLCVCGIQAGFGSPNGKISPWQRAVEEAIIKLLLEEYFKSSPYDEEDDDQDPSSVHHDGNGNNTPMRRKTEMLVHMFAMRRGLLEPYFRSPLADEFLTEELQAELIVRSGCCASLKYYQCNQRNMSLLLRCYRAHFAYQQDTRREMEGKCFNCSTPLQTFSRSFKPLSWDCMGIWALKQVGSLEKLIDIVGGDESPQLNVAGTFSTRFYQQVVSFTERLQRQGGLTHSEEEDLDSNGESSLPSCSTFH